MKVRALRKGYYDFLLRPEGEVFEIADDVKIGSWMERVADDHDVTRQEPNPVTGVAPGKKKESKPKPVARPASAPTSVI